MIFDAYSKYVKFIKFNGTHRKLRAEKFSKFLKGEDTLKTPSDLNENLSIRFSISENPTIEVSSS